MAYKNDFGFNADTDELAIPAWNEQPITLPLSTWTNSLLRIAELENELADVRRMWADANAKVRQLENENARLKGDLDAMLSAAEEVE